LLAANGSKSFGGGGKRRIPFFAAAVFLAAVFLADVLLADVFAAGVLLCPAMTTSLPK
jgi:hypothetical protein